MPFLPPRVKISRDDLGLALSLTAPSLALIFLASYLTSLVLSHLGEPPLADVSGNLFLVILSHAILTPLLEELLFRYVPIALLSPHSSAGAVIYSALFFAFVHASLYQLPYAFIAGVIFAVLDIATGSILPSITMHIFNNAISVLWLRYADAPSFRAVYVVILFALALSSVPFIIFKKYDF
jgi:membrane protease YdiL (CAAX protease family)